MNDYGIDNSWTRFYKIEHTSEPTFFEYLKPIYLYSNGKEMLLDLHNYPSMLILCDIEKETEKTVTNTTFLEKLYATEICFDSHLLLDDVDLLQVLKDSRFTIFFFIFLCFINWLYYLIELYGLDSIFPVRNEILYGNIGNVVLKSQWLLNFKN